MRHDQICIDSDRESHFRARDVEMAEAQYAPPAPPILVSEPVDVKKVVLVRAPVVWVGESHPSPHRQFYVGLAGELEITVRSSET